MRALLDLLFPPRCVGCGARREWLCPTCRSHFERLPAERCRRCAAPLAGVAICPDCWRNPPPFDGLTAPFRFAGTVRTSIHQLKYQGARHLAEPLADAALDAAPGLERPDVVVPVPLHPSRLAHRGFNQSGLLAKRIATVLAVPYLENGLVRDRDTPAQVGVPAAQRWTNVRDAFAAPAGVLLGKHILLVDDVATTTSTLRAAGRAAAAGGASRVNALVIARATLPSFGSNGTNVA